MDDKPDCKDAPAPDRGKDPNAILREWAEFRAGEFLQPRGQTRVVDIAQGYNILAGARIGVAFALASLSSANDGNVQFVVRPNPAASCAARQRKSGCSGG